MDSRSSSASYGRPRPVARFGARVKWPRGRDRRSCRAGARCAGRQRGHQARRAICGAQRRGRCREAGRARTSDASPVHGKCTQPSGRGPTGGGDRLNPRPDSFRERRFLMLTVQCAHWSARSARDVTSTPTSRRTARRVHVRTLPWIEHPHSARSACSPPRKGQRACDHREPRATSAARSAAVVDRCQGSVAAAVLAAIATAPAGSLSAPRIAVPPAAAVGCRLTPDTGARSRCGA
jgi:hypothetical protein